MADVVITGLGHETHDGLRRTDGLSSRVTAPRAIDDPRGALSTDARELRCARRAVAELHAGTWLQGLMLHIKLHDREPARPDDPMRRDWWGYDPNVPIDELFARNRGRWRLGPRAEGEKYAAFSYTGDHKIKFIAEIEAIETMGERRVIVGHVLESHHPLSKRWVDAPAPDSFRNPVTYFT